MKSKDKLELIDQKINILNKYVFSVKSWELSFVNKGANCYCLMIKENNKEICCGEFATFGSVVSALKMFECLFNKAIKKSIEESKKELQDKLESEE